VRPEGLGQLEKNPPYRSIRARVIYSKNEDVRCKNGNKNGSVGDVFITYCKGTALSQKNKKY
jgi:hypothetical protein